MKPLAILPAYLRRSIDLTVTTRAIQTLRETIGDRVDVLVVDDCSPAQDLAAGLIDVCAEHHAELELKDENEGFSRAVNIGLRRCVEENRDAILVNSDIEFGLTRDWLTLMQKQATSDEQGLASIVGALLLYPNGLIQHGGVYFSLLTREFNHRFHFGPGDLPEAQKAAVCPVTGALQFIRAECLQEVGIYDETFRMGWEDVDYCVRASLSGRECVYQPGIRAVHHESFFRGRSDEKIAKWTEESWLRFVGKYADVSFAAFVPNLLSINAA